MTDDLATLESQTYRRSFADGFIDLYVGVSLAWIGAAWIWIESLAGLAGVFPAVLVAPMLAWRKAVVEARTGYVRWAAPRRHWERRSLLVLLGAGLAMFAAGVVVLLLIHNGTGSPAGPVAAGLPAWLLALLATGTGVLIGARRMLVYAGLLVAGGVIVVAIDANPGWPMLISGGGVTLVGLVMVIRFLRSHPATVAP